MLIMMRGVPCSGKSTKAKELEQLLSPSYYTSSDEVRAKLSRDGSVSVGNRKVFEIMRNDIMQILQDKPHTWACIHDATNLRWRESKGLIIAALNVQSSVTIVNVEPPEFETSKETVEFLYQRSLQRAKAGGLYIPKDVIERMYDTWISATPRFQQECFRLGVEWVDFEKEE